MLRPKSSPIGAYKYVMGEDIAADAKSSSVMTWMQTCRGYKPHDVRLKKIVNSLFDGSVKNRDGLILSMAKEMRIW